LNIKRNGWIKKFLLSFSFKKYDYIYLCVKIVMRWLHDCTRSKKYK
jgi:hypothetical protein